MNPSNCLIRVEVSSDISAIYAAHAQAFPTEAEAKLVNQLRASHHLSLSLVAKVEGRVVGHIAFSPITVANISYHHQPLGIAPVGVIPKWQHRGIGSALIQSGLEQCLLLNVPFVVVLGEPSFYSRFGFGPAHRFGLENEYGAGEAFMVKTLAGDESDISSGLVHYGPEFAEL